MGSIRGAGAIVLALVLGAPVGGVPGAGGANAPDAAPDATHHVHIDGFAFSPAELTVAPGDNVEWHNHDFAIHTATDDGGAWDTGDLGFGQSGSIAFPAPASYAYSCLFHPFMTGSLDVALPGEPPSVSITAPAAGATVEGTVQVQGSASDPDGAVTLVEVRVDDGAFQPATGTTSWALAWDTAAVLDGVHTLTARATDDAGRTATAQRSVTVANPPAVAITSPATNSTVQGVVTIQGTASDPGPMSQLDVVEVRIDGGAWAPASGLDAWQFAWDAGAVPGGAHTIEARATDVGGATSPLASVSVTVVNLAPAIAFTAPAEGATVRDTVLVNGTAGDPEGDLERVELRIDGGAWRPVNGTSPWSFTWHTFEFLDGARLLEARAVDGAGNEVAASRTVQVANPPRVFFAAPREGQELVGTVLVRGTATDAGPAPHIARVEVRIDGGAWRLAQGTFDWSYAWDTLEVEDGPHTLEARSFDGALFSPVARVQVVTDNRHADLVVTGLASASTLLMLEQQVNVTVRNDGDEAAGAFAVRVTYAGAQGPRLVGEANLTGLAIGASATVSLDWATLGKAGNFTLNATADPLFQVEEHREDNNTRFGFACIPDTLGLACALPRIEVG